MYPKLEVAVISTLSSEIWNYTTVFQVYTNICISIYANVINPHVIFHMDFMLKHKDKEKDETTEN